MIKIQYQYVHVDGYDINSTLEKYEKGEWSIVGYSVCEGEGYAPSHHIIFMRTVIPDPLPSFTEREELGVPVEA